jgi:NADPH:quinone reductase-like Zn-dependent oxidoreductase
LRGLGAEVFVDVDSAPLPEVDLIFDLVGGETLRRACAMVRPGATVVSVVEDPPVEGNRRARFFVVEPSRPQLQELGKRVVAGELRPVVGAAWPLKEGRAAFEAKHRGGQAGKSVLLVAEES